MRTEETNDGFRNDLLAQDWETVYNVLIIDKTYDTFLRIVKSLHDEKQSNNPSQQKNRGWQRDYRTTGK